MIMAMKLSYIVLIFSIILYSLTIPAAAVGTLTLSASSAAAGDTVTVSGISAPDTWVAVKVLDSSDNIVFYDNVKTDMTGAYSCAFKIPADAGRRLKVVVGYGSNIASASINISRAQSSNDRDGGSTPAAPQQIETPKPEIFQIETNTVDNTVTVSVTVAATIDNSGKVTAEVTQILVSDAVSKALEEAEKQGYGMAAVVEIKVDADTAVKAVKLSLPKTAVDAVASSNTAALTVSSPVAAITFGDKALDTIAGAVAADLKISTAKVDAGTLSEEVKRVVGDRPVYDFSVTSGGKEISQFGGNVTVAVPYTPQPGEDINSIVIYYINAEGKPEIVSNCAYDPVTGTISFTTNHFSKYAVGYNKVTFKDVAADADYNEAVNFIAARGITSGTGDGNFSPEALITRGQFIVMLMNAYGIKPEADSKNNFADAENTYYTNYLAAAKRLGLANGIGNNMFAPDREITQQEMICLLYKTLNIIGELPTGTKGKDLTAYTDASQIAPWATEAMTLFVKAGIITGRDNKLVPTENANRAQMAQVLYNLLSK
jgi:hypothetical protein